MAISGRQKVWQKHAPKTVKSIALNTEHATIAKEFIIKKPTEGVF